MAVGNSLTIRQHRNLIRLVKQRMADRNWKVRDLASNTGYSERSIYRLSNPKIKASMDCVYEVMRVLEITMEDLE